MERARGPSPDDPEELSIDLHAAIARAIAQERVRVEYSENTSKDVRGWIVGVGISLTVAIIFGAWTFAEEFSALRQQVTDLKAEVEELKRLVEPRYRGAP